MKYVADVQFGVSKDDAMRLGPQRLDLSDEGLLLLTEIRDVHAAVQFRTRRRFVQLPAAGFRLGLSSVANTQGFQRESRAGMPTIQLRAATSDDAAEIVLVTRASIVESCVEDHRNDEATLNRWLRNKTVESVLAWLTDETNYFVVAEVDSVLGGVGSLKRGGLLTLLYVHPQYQALGVGRALLRNLEAWAERCEEHEIRFTSTAKARSFYERHGYVVNGPAEPHFGVLSGYPYVKVLRHAGD